MNDVGHDHEHELDYEPEIGWEQLPAGYAHKDVTDVDVDAEDNVYLLTRYDPRVIVYNSAGEFVRSFGEGLFTERPHGVTVGPDGHVYVVDEFDHTVQKFDAEGNRVMVFGTSGVASDSGYVHDAGDSYERMATITRPGGPFNQPTSVAITADGDLFVADGYGNCRVHHFTADGALVTSWGTPGTGPGEFHLPHAIALDADGRLLVADRENDRIQLFTQDGDFIEEWTDVHRPAAAVPGPDGLVFVPEILRPKGEQTWVHGVVDQRLAPRLTILDGATGRVVRRLGLDSAGGPVAPGSFAAPHGVAVDSKGDVYIAEVVYSMYVRPTGGKGPRPPAADAPDFQKLCRCHVDAPGAAVLRVERPSV